MGPVVSEKIVLLAAQSARSQAYAQILGARKLLPDHVILLAPSAKRKGKPTYIPESHPMGDLFVPDLSISLEQSLTALGCPVEQMSSDDLNTNELFATLEKISPQIVIYSGYGGQLVPTEMCTRWQFLHVHSGWLPNYRGSTTVYYSWLEEGYCGASAILLEPSIDSGPILMRKKFAAPSPEIDPDYLYDNVIRANVLADVLAFHQENGGWPEFCEQAESDATTYYKIHPVLKNILALGR